ncbi:MAG: leucine-rich repeat protein, partial [Clostridia bacterium]|nr:leucine-rich repeat protein [Clostridia bacterium]
YLIGRALGQGGFGITYIAMDLNLEIRVAIKEYYPEGLVSRDGTGRGTVFAHTGQGETAYAQGRERFLKEARVLAQFQYLPGVVTVREFFAANNTAYIVMEYIEGATLKAAIAKAPNNRLPAEPLLAKLEPLMESLEIIHSTGLLHRDISPDNIMERPDGSLVLLDFGAARQISAEGERSNTINVKHGYAPPEQYRTHGRQGSWTDVYALCATIYKLTTGVTPPQAMDRMAGGAALTPPRQMGADMTPAQEAAVLQGMAIDVNQRIPSVKDLRAALQAAKPLHAPGQRGESAPPRKRGSRAWVGVAAGMGGLLFIVALLAVGPKGRQAAPATAPALSAAPATAWAPDAAPLLSAPPATQAQESLMPAVSGQTEDGYTYAPYAKGVAITGYNGRESKLILPGNIAGFPVLRIENDAFAGSDTLQSVTISEGVEEIGENAFYRCDNLRFVSLPASLVRIGDLAFYNCRQLKTVTLPESLEYLEGYAFASCEALTEILLPGSIRNIGPYAFRGCPLHTAVLEEGIEQVGDYAFADTALAAVQLPQSLKRVGKGAFLFCELQSLVLPEGVTEIGAEAFMNMGALGGEGGFTISIPPSVTSIGDRAFATDTYIEPIVLVCDPGSYAMQYALENDVDYRTPYRAE